MNINDLKTIIDKFGHDSTVKVEFMNEPKTVTINVKVKDQSQIEDAINESIALDNGIKQYTPNSRIRFAYMKVKAYEKLHKRYKKEGRKILAELAEMEYDFHESIAEDLVRESYPSLNSKWFKYNYRKKKIIVED